MEKHLWMELFHDSEALEADICTQHKSGWVVDSSRIWPATRQRRDILSCLSFHVEKKAPKQQHQDQSRQYDDGLRNQCSASGCDHLARARNSWLFLPLQLFVLQMS